MSCDGGLAFMIDECTSKSGGGGFVLFSAASETAVGCWPMFIADYKQRMHGTLIMHFAASGSMRFGFWHRIWTSVLLELEVEMCAFLVQPAQLSWPVRGVSCCSKHVKALLVERCDRSD